MNLSAGAVGTPDHIRHVMPFEVCSQGSPEASMLDCGLESLRIDDQRLFVNVGERTNVTGSLGFVLIKEDFETALDVARDQVENRHKSSM